MKNPLPTTKNWPKNMRVATGALKHAPTLALGYSAYKAGEAAAKGDNKEALKLAAPAVVGWGVGKAGAVTCGALTVSGIGTLPGLACFALTAVASYASASGTAELIEEYVPD